MNISVKCGCGASIELHDEAATKLVMPIEQRAKFPSCALSTFEIERMAKEWNETHPCPLRMTHNIKSEQENKKPINESEKTS